MPGASWSWISRRGTSERRLRTRLPPRHGLPAGRPIPDRHPRARTGEFLPLRRRGAELRHPGVRERPIGGQEVPPEPRRCPPAHRAGSAADPEGDPGKRRDDGGVPVFRVGQEDAGVLAKRLYDGHQDDDKRWDPGEPAELRVFGEDPGRWGGVAAVPRNGPSLPKGGVGQAKGRSACWFEPVSQPARCG